MMLGSRLPVPCFDLPLLRLSRFWGASWLAREVWPGFWVAQMSKPIWLDNASCCFDCSPWRLKTYISPIDLGINKSKDKPESIDTSKNYGPEQQPLTWLSITNFWAPKYGSVSPTYEQNDWTLLTLSSTSFLQTPRTGLTFHKYVLPSS